MAFLVSFVPRDMSTAIPSFTISRSCFCVYFVMIIYLFLFVWPQTYAAICLFSLISTLFGLIRFCLTLFACRVLQADTQCRLCGPCSIWQMPASINASMASPVVVAPFHGGLLLSWPHLFHCRFRRGTLLIAAYAMSDSRPHS